MKASRELDALRIRVAVEIFGWKETDKRLPDHDPNWLEYEPPWFELPDGSIFHYTHMPDYPRNIADAWLVVEKFPNVAIFGPNDSWLVRFSDEDGSIYTHPVDEPARADTAPLAIV